MGDGKDLQNNETGALQLTFFLFYLHTFAWIYIFKRRLTMCSKVVLLYVIYPKANFSL